MAAFFSMTALALLIAPGFLLFRREDGKNLRARLLGYIFDLFCLLVWREGLVLLDVLLLFFGILADRLDLILLVGREVQRVVVFDGVGIR